MKQITYQHALLSLDPFPLRFHLLAWRGCLLLAGIISGLPNLLERNCSLVHFIFPLVAVLAIYGVLSAPPLHTVTEIEWGTRPRSFKQFSINRVAEVKVLSWLDAVCPCISRNTSIISRENSRHSGGVALRRPPAAAASAAVAMAPRLIVPNPMGSSDVVSRIVRRVIWLAAPTHLFLMNEDERFDIFLQFGFSLRMDKRSFHLNNLACFFTAVLTCCTCTTTN